MGHTGIQALEINVNNNPDTAVCIVGPVQEQVPAKGLDCQHCSQNPRIGGTCKCVKEHNPHAFVRTRSSQREGTESGSQRSIRQRALPFNLLT